MLTSITPLGERGRSQRYAVTMTAYALGCLLGGATTGALLGLVGSRLPALPVLLLGAAACLLAAVADLRGWLPLGRRQVDQDWLTAYRGWVYGAGFGFQLGLGVVTIISSAATLALLALALLTQSVAGGLLLGAVFGGTRALPTLLAGRVHTHADLRRVAAGLQRRASHAARATVAGLAAGGTVLLLAGVG
jgi:MFS family permease